MELYLSSPRDALEMWTAKMVADLFVRAMCLGTRLTAPPAVRDVAVRLSVVEGLLQWQMLLLMQLLHNLLGKRSQGL